MDISERIKEILSRKEVVHVSKDSTPSVNMSAGTHDSPGAIDVRSDHYPLIGILNVGANRMCKTAALHAARASFAACQGATVVLPAGVSVRPLASYKPVEHVPLKFERVEDCDTTDIMSMTSTKPVAQILEGQVANEVIRAPYEEEWPRPRVAFYGESNSGGVGSPIGHVISSELRDDGLHVTATLHEHISREMVKGLSLELDRKLIYGDWNAE